MFLTLRRAWWVLFGPDGRGHDNCQFCYGAGGGVLGNENRIGGLVVCDYCTARLTQIRDSEEHGGGKSNAGIFGQQRERRRSRG